MPVIVDRRVGVLAANYDVAVKMSGMESSLKTMKEDIAEIREMLEADRQKKVGVKIDSAWFPMKDFKSFEEMEDRLKNETFYESLVILLEISFCKKK